MIDDDDKGRIRLTRMFISDTCTWAFRSGQGRPVVPTPPPLVCPSSAPPSICYLLSLPDDLPLLCWRWPHDALMILFSSSDLPGHLSNSWRDSWWEGRRAGSRSRSQSMPQQDVDIRWVEVNLLPTVGIADSGDVCATVRGNHGCHEGCQGS